jgi:5-formyltetrahydrofolate cyclo-ligase
MDKGALRKQYRLARQLANPNFDETLTWRHILTTPEISGANFVASYNSYGAEPRTDDINRELIKGGKTLLLPRVLPDLNLEWVPWNGLKIDLVKRGNFFEPKGSAFDPSEIDVVIVPALHVNREGFRLGQGGGSYDRALVNMGAWRIALVYSGEITNEPLPIESHDQKVNAVATPELILRF